MQENSNRPCVETLYPSIFKAVTLPGVTTKLTISRTPPLLNFFLSFFFPFGISRTCAFGYWMLTLFAMLEHWVIWGSIVISPTLFDAFPFFPFSLFLHLFPLSSFYFFSSSHSSIANPFDNYA